MAVMILAASAACLVVNSFLSGVTATEEIGELTGHGVTSLSGDGLSLDWSAEVSSVWASSTGHSASLNMVWKEGGG